MEEIVLNEKLTLNDKTKYFFKNPSILFKQYIEKPKYGVTLLIFIIASAVYSASYTIGCKDLIIEMIEKQTQGIGQQQAVEFAKSMGTNPLISSVSAVIGAIIAVYLGSLVYFLVTKFDGGKITYKQTVSIYCLASIAPAIGLILKSVYVLISHKPILINPMNPTLVSTLLSYFDPFNIWEYVLLVIGISTVGKLSKKESTFIVTICVIISVCISLLLFALKLKK